MSDFELAQVTVWFAEESLFRDSLFFLENGSVYNSDQARQAFKEGRYEKKAVISIFYDQDGDLPLDEVYEMTQNIDAAWNKANPCRSASVGDIFQVGSYLYIVASCGFDKLGAIQNIQG